MVVILLGENKANSSLLRALGRKILALKNTHQITQDRARHQTKIFLVDKVLAYETAIAVTR